MSEGLCELLRDCKKYDGIKPSASPATRPSKIISVIVGVHVAPDPQEIQAIACCWKENLLIWEEGPIHVVAMRFIPTCTIVPNLEARVCLYRHIASAGVSADDADCQIAAAMSCETCL